MDSNSKGTVDFTACPKFDKYILTESQIEEIAELAARKALELGKEELQIAVGKTTIEFGTNVIQKLFYIVGAASLAAIVMGKAGISSIDFFKLFD